MLNHSGEEGRDPRREKAMNGINILFEAWQAVYPLLIGGAAGMLVGLAQARGWL